MRKRPARLMLTFISERKVVVRIGVGGSQLDGRSVGSDGILDPAGLVQHVAQIEVRQRIARIGLDRQAVMLLGGDKILTVVIQRAQVDVCSGVVQARARSTRR